MTPIVNALAISLIKKNKNKLNVPRIRLAEITIK